jgi:hypothetical protein
MIAFKIPFARSGEFANCAPSNLFAACCTSTSDSRSLLVHVHELVILGLLSIE